MDEKELRRRLRCLNCFNRMDIPPNAKMFTCPNCKVEYYIGWRGGQAKILGTPETGGG